MTERIKSGYAALQTGSGDVPTEGPYIVHGVAIGENDVTIGGSGKQTLWPRETLKEAAEGLEGQPLATDTNHTADDPKAQTPVEAIAGEVTWSGYKPGVGVLYEAEVDNKDLAEKINHGRLEVSPLVSRELEALESEKAEYKATEITRWRDLALVSNGAAPSNEITVGSNPMKAEALHETVESLQALVPPQEAAENARRGLECVEEVDTDAGEAQGRDTARQIIESVENDDPLSESMVSEIASFDRHREQGNHEIDAEFEGTPCEDNGYVSWQLWGGDAGVDWAQDENESMASTQGDNQEAKVSNAEALKEVAGVVFQDTQTGDLDESKIPNDNYQSHYLYPGETKTESSYPVVDADGNLRKGNVDAAWSLGARGDADESTHDERLMDLAEEFENPPEWAMDDAESMADIEDVSEDTLVKWNSSGDRDAYGMIVDVREEGDEPLDGEIDGDQTINPPAALIEVHTPGDDGWEATDTMVGHTLNTDTLEVIDELPDPESLAKHYDNMMSVPDEMKFDNPGEAMSKAEEMGFEEIHTHGEGEDTIFMPGSTHDELMEELDMGGGEGPQESMAPSNPVNIDNATMNDITEEELEALEQHREFANPKLVEQSEYEALQDRVADVRTVMEEALSEKTELKDTTIEALDFEALCSEFEGEDGSLQVEALRQVPESGEPESESEALSEDADMEKAEALFGDYQRMTNPPKGLKEDITEALGVSEFDEATEVLD